jgi:hypothetical protein
VTTTRWSLIIAAVVSGPLMLVVGAEHFGSDPMWIVFGTRAVILVWALVVSVALLWISYASRGLRWCMVGAATVLMAAAWMFPKMLVEESDRLGTYLHFHLHRGYYEQRVADHPGRPKLVVFSRGGMPWSFDGIVYDASDEVQLPPAGRSVDWKMRAAHTELSCHFEVRPLGAHFYAAHFDC